MKALIVTAHGSRRNESNEEVRRLAVRLHDKAGPAFDIVSCAFLEIAEPEIKSTISDLVAQGVKKIRIFPYFLAAGTHVVTDIPNLIAEAEKAHPEVDFKILPHLGSLQGMSTLILNQIYKGKPLNPSLASLATD
ncbi:MAG: CbiX/SirB N-terminal domain-containing protein [Kiritimatiellaceae bacterium]|nr:CbiX/SirB N-terminal domain-containing protein [Kiritimatiellaceae bacterium]